jgi:ribosomal protein S26
VAVFKREGEVAQKAMDRVLDDATAVAADIDVGKMHAAAARKAVENVLMKAAMAALRNNAAMVSLEAVAKEAAKVAACASCTMASSCARPRTRRRCTSMTPQTRIHASPRPLWWRPGRRRGCSSTATR